MRLECVTRPSIWWIKHFYASTIFLVQGPSWRFMRILQAGRTSWAVKWGGQQEDSQGVQRMFQVETFVSFFCKTPSSWNAFLKREKITLVRDFPPFSEILSAYIELRGISGITNTPTWLADYSIDPRNNNNTKLVIAQRKNRNWLSDIPITSK